MKRMKQLIGLLEGARKGGWALRKLNWALAFAIPFNRRHGFKVLEVGENGVKTYAPYLRKNFNHIGGIHACGIATIAEFCTGLTLLRRIDAGKYRIIMSKMEVEYHFQAKKPLIAEASISEEELNESILLPLSTRDSVEKTLQSIIKDSGGNHIATAHITWQFKAWDKVKTPVQDK